MQGVRHGAILNPQGQVGAVDFQGPSEAVQDRRGVLPDGPITLQLIGVQLVLNATSPGQSHACPGIKPVVTTKSPVNTRLPLEHCRHDSLQGGDPRFVGARLPGQGPEPSSTTQ